MGHSPNAGKLYVKQIIASLVVTASEIMNANVRNQRAGNSVKHLFDANKDGNTVRLNKLPCPVLALCARVNPTKWHGHISMRFDVRGCDGSIQK
ncbi:hypothetical protein DPMN_186723 [Dreissena polymorpha]|uniref:Uncharacterized protein n=1 Tax=Dreissena polymorpha TaxID=45954 RepID=A0A9D4DN43_DREPO|nr:hypothetical protein DPMN_186723 [Dreissena polymorpha]